MGQYPQALKTVQSIVKESIECVQESSEAANITISMTSESCIVWADRDRIVQVLTNLLSNAINFSHSHTTIMLVSYIKGNQIQFEVKDNGRGIPSNKLEAIFGRFQQVDASDVRQRGGTGLGLAICYDIIQQHGGKIWAESILEIGSSFHFTLPLEPVDGGSDG